MKVKLVEYKCRFRRATVSQDSDRLSQTLLYERSVAGSLNDRIDLILF
jgi:hypothetical protein